MMTFLYEALKNYGLAEIAGPSHNSKILEMSKALGFPFKTDEDSWCGIFMAHSAVQAGLRPPEKSYSARSWLKWGVDAKSPETGDIVVFWRESPDSWQGHVGLFVNWANDKKTHLNVLGGNQGNCVCIAKFDAQRVLGFRRLA